VVVNGHFHVQAALHADKNPRYLLETKWCGTQSQPGSCRGKKISLSLPRIELRIVQTLDLSLHQLRHSVGLHVLLYLCLCNYWNRDKLVKIATWLQFGIFGVEIPTGGTDCFSETSKLSLSPPPHSLLLNCTGFFFTRVQSARDVRGWKHTYVTWRVWE
jgi:hypothetical protein